MFCYDNNGGSCDRLADSVSNLTEYACQNQTITDEIFWSDAFCPKTSASWLAVFGMVLYLVSFSPGLGPVPWAVCSEIFPQSCREAGVAMSTATNWMANCLVSLTFLRYNYLLNADLYFQFFVKKFQSLETCFPFLIHWWPIRARDVSHLK